jgi:HlyD family secretion protein
MSAADAPLPALRTDLGRLAWLGGFAGVALLVLLVAWAAVTPIAGAVIVQGQAVVHGKPKLVQSLDGGIVAAIEVAAGDSVAAGQLLLRLDATQIAASLEIARAKLAEDLARRARLESEELGLPAPEFRYPPLPFAQPQTARQEEGERQVFAARAALLQGREAQLAERRAQIATRTEGLRAQIAAKRDQLALLEEDLGNVAELARQGLARDSQRLDLERARSDLLGQISELGVQVAEITNSVRDAELETLQQKREFAESVVTDLRLVNTEIETLVPQILTLEAQLSRVEIRAPAGGVVHEMAATTVGGVIAPGAVILQVVPLDAGLDFELRLDPRLVDQVHPGQAAQVVMAALDPRATPRLAGTVAGISPGTIADPVTGAPFYRVTLNIPPAELARLGTDVDLVPGMPVEAFLETGDRTVLRYLLKPLSSQVARTFRER